MMFRPGVRGYQMANNLPAKRWWIAMGRRAAVGKVLAHVRPVGGVLAGSLK